MRWYSVKTHKPYQGGYCIVRTENGAIYAAEWRGGSVDGGSDYSCGWMMDTLCEDLADDAPSYVEIFGVTHFIIPEPVEIEPCHKSTHYRPSRAYPRNGMLLTNNKTLIDNVQ